MYALFSSACSKVLGTGYLEATLFIRTQITHMAVFELLIAGKIVKQAIWVGRDYYRRGMCIASHKDFFTYRLSSSHIVNGAPYTRRLREPKGEMECA